MRIPLITALLLFAAGCVAFPTDERLFINSEPSGAAISLDGQSTGMITPCILAVSSDSVVELALKGYPPARRKVKRVTHFRVPVFADGGSPHFESPTPLAWIMTDLLFPFQWYTRNEPTRLHVTFRASKQ